MGSVGSTARELLVGVVFPALRRRGFLARANFACCGGCGHYELSQLVVEKRRPGYVFWHAQDDERMPGRGRRESWHKGSIRKDGTFIRFGIPDFPKAVTREELGEAVVEEAKLAGLSVEWDGDPDMCVWVEAVG